jgi:hypothetical protein
MAAMMSMGGFPAAAKRWRKVFLDLLCKNGRQREKLRLIYGGVYARQTRSSPSSLHGRFQGTSGDAGVLDRPAQAARKLEMSVKTLSHWVEAYRHQQKRGQQKRVQNHLEFLSKKGGGNFMETRQGKKPNDTNPFLYSIIPLNLKTPATRFFIMARNKDFRQGAGIARRAPSPPSRSSRRFQVETCSGVKPAFSVG